MPDTVASFLFGVKLISSLASPAMPIHFTPVTQQPRLGDMAAAAVPARLGASPEGLRLGGVVRPASLLKPSQLARLAQHRLPLRLPSVHARQLEEWVLVRHPL
jgi:hypothetical protein